MRPIQRDALDWAGANWGKSPLLFMGLGVGAGKSAILRTIQRKVGGHLLTSQNHLINQYVADYPDMNKLIGGAHYKCSSYLSTCNIASVRYSCKGDGNTRCCYQEARDQFISGTPSILNLMSFFINSVRYSVPSTTMLIDEVHTVPGLIRQLTSSTVKFGSLEKAILKKLKYEKKDLISELKLTEFFRCKVERLNELMAKEKDPQKVEKYWNQIENAQYTLQAFESEPEKFVVQFEDNALKVLPVLAPRRFMDRVLGRGGVFTSATLMDYDMREIAGNMPYMHHDFGTPIPAANRQIKYEPMPFGFDYNSIRPDEIAKKIMEIYIADKQPTVVHLTYDLASRLKEFMFHKDIIWHDKDTKDIAVATYKARGGLLMASGLSEGLDLKDDLCRRQIITKLQFGNIGDLYTKKRRALSDGNNWYLGEVFKVFCQSVGRSTRSATDYSQVIVLDSRFANTFKAWKREGFVRQWFEDSIDWGK